MSSRDRVNQRDCLSVRPSVCLCDWCRRAGETGGDGHSSKLSTQQRRLEQPRTMLQLQVSHTQPFIYLFVEKVHMKETKQMTLQLDRKVHDSNTCPTLKNKNTL